MGTIKVLCILVANLVAFVVVFAFVSKAWKASRSAVSLSLNSFFTLLADGVAFAIDRIEFFVLVIAFKVSTQNWVGPLVELMISAIYIEIFVS